MIFFPDWMICSFYHGRTDRKELVAFFIRSRQAEISAHPRQRSVTTTLTQWARPPLDSRSGRQCLRTLCCGMAASKKRSRSSPMLSRRFPRPASACIWRSSAGALVRSGASPEEAQASFQLAIDVARDQGAKSRGHEHGAAAGRIRQTSATRSCRSTAVHRGLRRARFERGYGLTR
jgi:hypothetical protein